MEEARKNRFRINGWCPKCGEMLNVTVDVTAELEQKPESEEKEAKPDADQGKGKDDGSDSAEGDSVRPADAEGKPGATDTANKPADSGKGRRAKKPGGK